MRYEKLVFDSYEAFRKVMTPERLKILHVIREKEPKSVYELAKILDRDRRNIIKDLEMLEMLGLVEFEEEKHGKRRSRRPSCALRRDRGKHYGCWVRMFFTVLLVVILNRQ